MILTSPSLASFLKKSSHKWREFRPYPAPREKKKNFKEQRPGSGCEGEGWGEWMFHWPNWSPWTQLCLKLFVLILLISMSHCFPIWFSQFELGHCNFQLKEFQLTRLLLWYVVKIEWGYFSKGLKTINSTCSVNIVFYYCCSYGYLSMCLIHLWPVSPCDTCPLYLLFLYPKHSPSCSHGSFSSFRSQPVSPLHQRALSAYLLSLWATSQHISLLLGFTAPRWQEPHKSRYFHVSYANHNAWNILGTCIS